MTLSTLSHADQRIIRQCLVAVARGAFFSDAELRIVSGLERSEWLAIVARLPRIDGADPKVRRAIGHALAVLPAQRHCGVDNWNAWIAAQPAEVERVAARWFALLPRPNYDSIEVFGPVYLAGRYYRVVSYRTRGGGSGAGTEVWSSGKWLGADDGPGIKEVRAALPATAAELAAQGIDRSTVQGDYDPLAVEREARAAEA